MLNNKKNIKLWWVLGSIALLWGILLWGIFLWEKSIQEAAPNVNTNSRYLPGIQTGDAPWAPEISHLSERWDALGLPLLRTEGRALHTHQHLDIFINGEVVPVPAYIGIDEDAGFMSDIHTYSTDGVIHVESPKIQVFTLGQFFEIWGVDFTSQNIGGYKNQGDKTLRVFVNGTLISSDPTLLELQSHQVIVITYGTDQELPKPIPATYIFPEGYN